MSDAPFTLRPYRDADEDAAIALWQVTWQQAYPHIAFAKRVEWWRSRWRDDLVPHAKIVVAERGGAMAGFVTIDVGEGYLDQLAVAPEHWGHGLGRQLLQAAQLLSPGGIALHVNQDNARAIGLYKACGFVIAGEDVNPHSQAPVYLMRWTPS